MKARNQLHIARDVGTADMKQSYHAESSPNSSAVLAVTVLADIEDVLAVIRTAALLGKSFKGSTSVDLPGEDTIHIESADNLSQASLAKLLDSIQGKLCKLGSSQAPVFAVEATITAASFLANGAVSVHVRGIEPAPKRPTVAR